MAYQVVEEYEAQGGSDKHAVEHCPMAKPMKFAHFEKIFDKEPETVLGVDSTKDLIAMQVRVCIDEHTTHRSALWNKNTCRLIWEPEAAIAITWLRNGAEVAIVKEKGKKASERQVGMVPIQSDYFYLWERYSWPERQLLASCTFTLPTGWPQQIFVSPAHDVAVIQWFDQCESGLEFIRIATNNDSHLTTTGFPIVTNLSTHPVFHPRDHCVVMAWQDEWEWWQKGSELDLPVQEGEYQAGRVSIFNWDNHLYAEVDIIVHLEEGWEPPSDEEALIRDLSFSDNEHVVLTLAGGIKKIVTLPTLIS